MKSWATVTLGDICELKYGKSLPAGKRSPGSVPVYGSNGIVGVHESAITNGPTIIVGRKGSFGEVHYSSKPCWPIDTTYFVDASCTDADLRWLSHLLPSLRLRELNRAAAIPGLNRDDAYRRTLLLPPIEEQRRTAAILDQADALRAKRREYLDRLGSLTESIFLDMSPRANVPQVPLAEALRTARVFTDGDWVESKDQDPTGDVRLTQLADVGDGSWLDKSRRFLTRQKASQLRCTFLEPGDVLVARMPDPLGRACVFPGDSRPCVTVVDVCVIRPDPARHTPEWLTACINSLHVRHQIAQLATGTTRSRVSRGNLKKVFIPDVPIELQRDFSLRMEQLSDVRTRARRDLDRQVALTSSLTARAFGVGI